MFLLLTLKPLINTHDPQGHLQTRAQQHGHPLTSGWKCGQRLREPQPASPQGNGSAAAHSDVTEYNYYREREPPVPGECPRPRPVVRAETTESKFLPISTSLQGTTHALLQERPWMEGSVARK